jgi:mannose-1-phosphate guanylyltransferase
MIGAGCTIGARTVVAGGAIVGDGCRIGADNRLDKGMKLWPDTALNDQSVSF